MRPGFRAWIFTAMRSRHRFVYPVFRETTASAIEACEAAWAFFGGVFRGPIPDNIKAIVHTADDSRRAWWMPSSNTPKPGASTSTPRGCAIRRTRAAPSEPDDLSVWSDPKVGRDH
jgi:hypothetical protein